MGRGMAENEIKAVIENDNRFDLTDAGKACVKLNRERTTGKIVINTGIHEE